MAAEILHARLALGLRDSVLAQRYADLLEELGFRIVRSAPRGISFEGGIRLFENVFACPIDLKPTPHFVGDPRLPPGLHDHTDGVYFPTKPTFF